MYRPHSEADASSPEMVALFQPLLGSCRLLLVFLVSQNHQDAWLRADLGI